MVCKQLGFSRAIAFLNFAAFGAGTADQPIWLDQVRCNGSEADLSQCTHNPIGSHDCLHREDASVVCSQGMHTLVVVMVMSLIEFCFRHPGLIKITIFFISI